MTNINLQNLDLVSLSTDEMIKMLTTSFTLFINNALIDEHPSVFLHGQPGVGKSQAVYKIANTISKQFHINTKVIDIRLLLFNPVDLRGIPVADKETGTSIWLKPEIFNFHDDEKTIYFLFLDELTSAPSSLQAAAYQIALDRRIGEHYLPKNTFVIAAGNRDEDFSINYEMPTALRNRFMHIELKPDLNSWLIWANNNHIHPRIISFLNEHPDKFYTKDLSIKSPIIITPRTWEMLSKVLHLLEDDLSSYSNLLSSIVGTSITRLLIERIKGFDIRSLVDGEMNDLPKSLEDVQNAITTIESSLDGYMENENAVIHILEFLKEVPIDFSLRVFRKMLKYDTKTYDISKLDAYHELIQLLEKSE
jgi:MoxR-like ATPase